MEKAWGQQGADKNRGMAADPICCTDAGAPVVPACQETGQTVPRLIMLEHPSVACVLWLRFHPHEMA